MKRIFAAILSLIISLAFITGCAVRQEPSTGKGNGTSEHSEEIVPYDAQLEIICANGKLIFSRIATTPRVRVGRPPFDETCIITHEDKHEIISALFQAMNGKETVEQHESLPTLQLLLYGQDDDEPWHYLFEIGTEGLVRVSNNGDLICYVQISEEELQSIIQVLD